MQCSFPNAHLSLDWEDNSLPKKEAFRKEMAPNRERLLIRAGHLEFVNLQSSLKVCFCFRHLSYWSFRTILDNYQFSVVQKVAFMSISQ